MPEPGDTPSPAAPEPEGFAPYDPQAVQPTTSPTPSSEPPETHGGTSGEDGANPEGTAEPLPEFDPRHREEFTGLLYLGALTEEFDWAAHRFKIRTLTTGELGEIALALKPYEGVDADNRMYVNAVVAACVISVDGVPMPEPISKDPADTPFSNRFKYVLTYWHPPVVDAIYNRFFALEITVRQVLAAMGNRSG
jgi:hypothetical protein